MATENRAVTPSIRHHSVTQLTHTEVDTADWNRVLLVKVLVLRVFRSV
ncbi:MAG: hypothetical protein ABSA12_13110 [Verrucomicrobiia bacterium]